MEMKKYKLGEICRIASARRIFENEYVAAGIPFIRGQEVSDGSLMNPKSKFQCYISKKRFEELKKEYGIPKKGDILITAVGTIGNLCYLDKDIDFYFKDGNLIWFSDFKEDILSEYLYFFMKEDYFKKQLNHTLIGAVQKALTMEKLSKIEIIVPPLPTQQKIAAVLSSLDKKIALNCRINARLEQMAKRLYEHYFVQFDFPTADGKPYKTSGGKMVYSSELKREIPDGWEVKSIKSVMDCDISGDWGQDIQKGNYDYKVNCIRGCDITDMTSLPQRFILTVNSKKLLEENDFVIEISGGSPTQSTGRIIQITREILDRFNNKLICSNFCRGIRLSNKNYVSYFNYMWKMFYQNDVFFNYEGKTSGLKNFQFDTFVNEKWYFPDEKLVKQFNEVIFQIKKEIDKNELESARLTSLRDRLLPLLMNGQVSVE